jgi:hypothetical protein
LLLVADTWYKLGLSFNYTTGEIKVKELNGLFNRSFASSASTVDVGEVDILGSAGGTTAAPNTAASIGVFDNLLIRASSSDTLLGVNNNNLISSKFTLYPNPAKEFITISSPNVEIKTIQINDINGRFVKDIDVNNSNEVEINISNLSQGIYFIKIISEKETVTKKLIVE